MTASLKFQFRNQTYLCTFKWGMTLFSLFFFLLFCYLGVWQYHRYQFKKELLTKFEETRNAAPLPLESVIQKPVKEIEFQNVTAEGYYLNALTMFVQNQYYQDQTGYEVVTPFMIPRENKVLLVDRGWVKSTDIPKIPFASLVKIKEHIKGYIKLLNEHNFILGKNILYPDKRPLVVQKIDLQELTNLTGLKFFPFIVRLNASEPNGFVRDWVITSIMPERHLGYCVQWFIMALVIFIAYFCFCCEKIKNAP